MNENKPNSRLMSCKKSKIQLNKTNNIYGLRCDLKGFRADQVETKKKTNYHGQVSLNNRYLI
jgi:hypothetical protein